MLNVKRYELDQDVQRYVLDSDEEIPDAPESWSLEDFDDVLTNDDFALHDFDLH